MLMGIDLCYPAISVLNVGIVIALNATTDFYLMSVPLPVSALLQTLTSHGTDIGFADDLAVATCHQEEVGVIHHVLRRSFDHGSWHPPMCSYSHSE